MIVPGFQAAATAAGIKKNGGLDLALIVADTPCAAAGVFTRNRVKAAPVLLSRERLRRHRLQAVLINSGNANACTGAQGMTAAVEATRQAAQLLGLPENLVAPASTGVIGQPLPLERIIAALPDLVASLSPEGLGQVAQAIMTTDTRPKTAFIRETMFGVPVTMVGIAKGAGMIHPDMATLLAFVFTDAAVTGRVLKHLLKEAVNQTFNRITIDGDTSTNDTVLALASGKAGNPLIADPRLSALSLRDWLKDLLTDLARQVVADGEGAMRTYRILVQGAASPRQAQQAAAAIATSPLVKTAMNGADVNWGRIMAALGRSGANFQPERVDITFGPHQVVKNGQGLGIEAENAARQVILDGPFTLTVHLHAGNFSDYYDTCDLSQDYIRINASYRS